MRNKKKKIIVTLIGCAIGACLFLSLLVYPTFGQIQALSKELTLAEKELQNVLGRAKEMSFWQKRYPEMNAHFQMLESVFVDPDFPVDFIRFIEELAEKSGVEVEISLVSSGPKEEEEAPCLRLGIVVRGETSACLAFLDKLENSAYLVSIEHFKLFKPEARYQKNDEDRTELRMTIKVLTLEYETEAEN